MKKVLFSVLMSVYYKEKPSNLQVSLESVMNQTLRPNEVVLVKDGPLTKELDDVIDVFNKKYKCLTLVKLKKNSGLGNALNEGLKHCKYDYVARMDSDDISLENRFEMQANFIANHPEVDVVGGYIQEFDDETGEDISIRSVPQENDDIKLFLKKRNPMNHAVVFFKKESVLKAGSYIDCPYFEDYYLWARMLNQGCRFFNIDQVLLRVRAGSSLSKRRGSFTYVKCIFYFEKKLYELNMINAKDFLINVSIRSLVAIFPNKIRAIIYRKRLRDEAN